MASKQAAEYVREKVQRPSAGATSTVLVQGSEHDRNDDWIYRPDDKLADEIGRMEKFATVAAGKSSEYRLNDESFYLKFVKRNGLLKNGSILTPLAHFKQIVGAPGSAGSRGGVRISYEQLDGCYMRHSTFIDLFQAGYIGAYSATTIAFQTLIEQVVAGNRSVVAAIQYASLATDDQTTSRHLGIDDHD